MIIKPYFIVFHYTWLWFYSLRHKYFTNNCNICTHLSFWYENNQSWQCSSEITYCTFYSFLSKCELGPNVLISTHVIFLLCFYTPCAQTGRRGREDVSICSCKVYYSNYLSVGLWMSDAFTGHIAKDSSQEVPSKLTVLLEGDQKVYS